MPDSNLPKSDIAKKNVLKIMQPLVTWLIKSGVGFSEFSQLLKTVFFIQSIKELEILNQKNTDSSISLLAGLNRRDVSDLKKTSPEKNSSITTSSNISARIITLWIQKQWSKQISVSGQEVSFETLAKEVSQDKHPRAILSELQRLGLVTEIADTVILHTDSFTPSNSLSHSQNLLAQATSDHISSGISNIFITPNLFLEQSLHADELTEESIQELKNYSNDLWKELSQKMLDKALECTKKDEGKKNAQHRFSLGIYQFNEIIKEKNPLDK